MAFDLGLVNLEGIEQADEERETDTLRSNYSEALKLNPDQHAKQVQLSEATDVPTFAIDESVEQGFKLDQVDFNSITERSPNTAEYLSNFDNSVIAQDDIEVMQAIEDVFDFGKVTENIGETITTGFEAQAKGLQLTGIDATPDRVQDLIPFGALPMGITMQQTQSLSMDLAENLGITTDEQLQTAKAEATETMLAELRELHQKRADLTPEDLNTLEQGVRGGIESLGNMAPGFALMLLTGGRAAPLLGTIGVQTFGASYGEGRVEGLSPQEAGWFASIDAAIEVGTELLPTKTLETIITGASKGLKKEALKFMVREMGTEQLATLGQSLNSYAFGLDEQMENATPAEMVQIQLQRQAVTAIATVVAGGAQVTAATGLRKGIEALTQDETAKQTKGEIEQSKLDQLNAQSEKSKLRERDKESFKQFVEKSDGENNTHVFIDGAQTSLYLQSKTPEEIAVDPALQLLSEQVREAAALGGDVQVPVADFAADIAGTDTYEQLRDSMTMSDETISPFRQEQQQQETETYVRNLMDEAQESASEYVEAQEIYTTVRDQLIDSGQVTPANASIMAQVVPAWATAQARRQGKTVQQVYQDAGLVIEGPQTGERARLEGEQILEQPVVIEDSTDEIGSNLGVEVRTPSVGREFDKDLGRSSNIIFDDAIVQLSIRDDTDATHVTGIATKTSDDLAVVAEGTGRGTQVLEELKRQADLTGKKLTVVDATEHAAPFYDQIPWLTREDVTLEFEGEQYTPPISFAYVPQRATIPVREEITDEETRQKLESDRRQREARQVVIEEAKTRDDAEALSEFNRAKTGETVTFTRRSRGIHETFDDTKLGANTTTPSAYLGHYLSAADVGNVEKYGPELSVYEVTLTNPLMISPETFESATADLTPEQAAERREQFIGMGHDGILVEGLNWMIVFEGAKVQRLEEDVEGLLFAQEPVPVSTETEEFKAWSGGGEVIEPEDVNDYTFKADTPAVVKVFHGTTHKFDVFDALRGNLEGQFGAINYFTSSEQDATDNYAGEGPDLTSRIEQRAEELSQKLEDQFEERGREEVLESLNRSTGELRFVSAKITEMDDTDAAFDAAKVLARIELSGGQEETMGLFVRVDNPFVIGENAEWIEFVDNEAVISQAIEQVAEDNDIEVSEVEENRDDYEDKIDEARWEIQDDQPHKLILAIQEVADRHDVNDADLYNQVLELGSEATPESIENLLRESEDYQYADDPETGALIQSQLIAEVIEEMGFDSIILKNAEARFETTSMESGTAHVHVFDSGKTNIKSVENIGTFDPTDPSIFRQRTNGEKPEARGYYDPANSVIRLTEAADLSTFLHEFAHFMYEMEVNGDTEMLQSINNWYKRNAEDVAKEAMTYDENITILPKHVEQFLDEGAVTEPNYDEATNERATKAVRRSVHEQFARGFETYLMEGKAPSIELRNAFRAFARWLSRIYQALRNQLKVNLDAEMRAVFDRLLATEDQIAAAEARARVEPMFTDAAMAGMTEAEFADYQTRQEKVKDVQSETLRDKLIKQLTRQTKVWWKEEKQDIIDEEIETLGREQVYVARARLRDGDIKLDHVTVKEMVGEEKTDKLGRTSVIIPPKLVGTTAKGQKGVHPDEAAAFFGYNSGSEMLNDLTTAPNIKVAAETVAEARMVERHGDILTDGTIQKEADEAVMNEERGKLILRELKALAKGTNAPTIDRATIKDLAEQNIGKLSFRQIHPGKYRKAEIRAAQEASRMLAEGNREGAASAKMQQVMNYYLGMAATNARNETTKIVDRMSRYNKKNVREAIQKVEGGYWEQLTKILDRFEFRKSATLKEVESLNVWMNERNGEAGDSLVLTNPVLNESYVTHWKNVPFTDLQGISDSVKNIEHVARYADKLTRMQEEIDFNKLVDRWVTSMNENVKTRFVSKRTDVVEGRKWGRWFMAQMTKIPYMASWLDGGERAGISHQIMVQPFTDAYNAEIQLWAEAGKPVMDAIENRSKEDRKRHNRKIFIPEIDDNLYGHQILAVALNTGNQSNLKKMLLGEGWANPEIDTDITFGNPQLQAVLSNMTKSDWELVQLIWDQMDTLYPKLAEVHRRTTGLTPPKIESQPVETEFGTFKGGYYPVRYDPNRDQRAQQNEDKLNAETESMFSNSASIQSSVNTGATNERTGYYAPIRLSIDVVPAHFQETIHYITHHDPVREVNRLTRNKQVTQTIKEKLGPEEYAQLRPWLNDIAKDGREAPTKMFWDDMLQRLRFGVTLGVMGFKASTGIIQISGLSNSIAEVGTANMFQSMRSILGSTTTIKQAWDFAVENSKVMEHRAQTMDREIKNAMKRIEGKRGVLAAAQEASMKHIALIQTYMVDLPSWHAAYIKGMQDWGDETRAFQYADWVIENVQGSGATKDMARIMRGQSETGRMFTMFMTFFSSLWNMERDLVKGAKSGRYSPTNVAAKAMFLFTIPVLFEMMMRGELGAPDEGDDDERLQKMLTGVAMFPVQSIPFIRDIASATTGEFGYNISPLASVIEQGTRTIPALIERGFTDEEITKGQVKGATKFIGATLGIPGVNQAWATGEHLYDVIEEGEELTLHQTLFGPERK